MRETETETERETDRQRKFHLKILNVDVGSVARVAMSL